MTKCKHDGGECGTGGYCDKCHHEEMNDSERIVMRKCAACGTEKPLREMSICMHRPLDLLVGHRRLGMERYSNGRSLLRQGGRFAKQPTLEQIGFPVAKGNMKCVCGHEWMPILTTGYCPKCGSQDKVPNVKLTGGLTAESEKKRMTTEKELKAALVITAIAMNA